MLRYITILLLPAFVFANSDAQTDILPRTVNFLIFAAILYYLLADIIKNFFKNRKKGIADKLNAIQEKLKESKNQKNLAIAKVEEAKANAKAFIATSDKENKLLLSKIAIDLKNELDNLEKAHSDQIDIERRKMVRVVVSEVLDDLFSADSIAIDRDKFVNIILKKVA